MSWTDNPGSPTAIGTPPPAASPDHVAAARDLLARTAELPDTKRELMKVLSEYRAALLPSPCQVPGVETAREMARATATTAGFRAAGSTFPGRVMTESAATSPRRVSTIGQATEVIGSGRSRDTTATPSRRIAARCARRSRPDR